MFKSLHISLQHLGQKRIEKAFLNFIYFHTLFVLLKPVQLFSIPHKQIIFPMRYYQHFFDYDKTISKNLLPFEAYQGIYRLTLEQNCANSVIESFSFANSQEQYDLQAFFVANKFDSKIKSEVQLMLKKLIKSANQVSFFHLKAFSSYSVLNHFLENHM